MTDEDNTGKASKASEGHLPHKDTARRGKCVCVCQLPKARLSAAMKGGLYQEQHKKTLGSDWEVWEGFFVFFFLGGGFEIPKKMKISRIPGPRHAKKGAGGCARDPL